MDSIAGPEGSLGSHTIDTSAAQSNEVNGNASRSPGDDDESLVVDDEEAEDEMGWKRTIPVLQAADDYVLSMHALAEEADASSRPPSKRRLLSIEQSLTQLDRCGHERGWMLADLSPDAEEKRSKGFRFLDITDFDAFPPILFEFFDWLAGGRGDDRQHEEDDEEGLASKGPSNVSLGRVARDIGEFLSWLRGMGYLDAEDPTTTRMMQRAARARHQAKRAGKAASAFKSFAEATSLLYDFPPLPRKQQRPDDKETNSSAESGEPPDPHVYRQGWMVVSSASAAGSSRTADDSLSFGVASFRKHSHLVLRPSFDVFLGGESISSAAGPTMEVDAGAAEIEVPDQLASLVRAGDLVNVELRREQGPSSASASQLRSLPWRVTEFAALKARGWHAATDDAAAAKLAGYRDTDYIEVVLDDEEGGACSDDEYEEGWEDAFPEEPIGDSKGRKQDGKNGKKEENSSSTSTAFRAARFGAAARSEWSDDDGDGGGDDRGHDLESSGDESEAADGASSPEVKAGVSDAAVAPLLPPRQGPPPASWEDEVDDQEASDVSLTAQASHVRGGAGLAGLPVAKKASSNAPNVAAKGHLKASGFGKPTGASGPPRGGPSRMAIPKSGGTAKPDASFGAAEALATLLAAASRPSLPTADDDREDAGGGAASRVPPSVASSAAARGFVNFGPGPGASGAARGAGTKAGDQNPFGVPDDDPMQLLLMVPGMRELAAAVQASELRPQPTLRTPADDGARPSYGAVAVPVFSSATDCTYEPTGTALSPSSRRTVGGGSGAANGAKRK